MADYGKLNFSVAFNPTSAFPLDARLVFNSYEEALEAARTAGPVGSTDTIYHYGMIFTVVAADGTTKYYSVTQEKNLVPFVSSGGEIYKPFEIEVSPEDSIWREISKTGNSQGGPRYEIKILQVIHGFKNIHDIRVEAIEDAEDPVYEKVVYTYKRYKSGSISIFMDKKIKIKILIKGDK